jgi:hypothetical protein
MILLIRMYQSLLYFTCISTKLIFLWYYWLKSLLTWYQIINYTICLIDFFFSFIYYIGLLFEELSWAVFDYEQNNLLFASRGWIAFFASTSFSLVFANATNFECFLYSKSTRAFFACRLSFLVFADSTSTTVFALASSS